MVRLQQNPGTHSIFLNIPKELARAMNFEKGQEVQIKVIDSRTIQIRKEL